MKRILFLIYLSTSLVTFAQNGNINVMPKFIHFSSMMERNKSIIISAMGGESQIDSIVFDKDILQLLFPENISFPYLLNQNKNLEAEIILFNYYSIDKDSINTIDIYSPTGVVKVELKMSPMMQNNMKGSIEGLVTEGVNKVDLAKIYFFIDGNKLIDSTETNIEGKYNKVLPRGNYFVLAEKTGFYSQLANKKYTLETADFVNIMSDSISTINFELDRISANLFSLTGRAKDAPSDSPSGSTIIVVRRGTHTPTKITNPIDERDEYVVLSDINGSYNVDGITSPGKFTIKSYSNFHQPSYYNNSNLPSATIENADSVLIDGKINGANLYMNRSNAYGGAKLSGLITNEVSDSSSRLNYFVFAESETGDLFNYNFSNGLGEFYIPELPFGKLRVGITKENSGTVYSDYFNIIEENQNIDNIIIDVVSKINEKEEVKLSNFFLYQNFPNPFNPTSIIKINIPEDGVVTLIVYNSLGEKVKELVNRWMESGVSQFEFNGVGLSSGIYYYQVKYNNLVITKKMMLLK